MAIERAEGLAEIMAGLSLHPERSLIPEGQPPIIKRMRSFELKRDQRVPHAWEHSHGEEEPLYGGMRRIKHDPFMNIGFQSSEDNGWAQVKTIHEAAGCTYLICMTRIWLLNYVCRY